MLFLPLSLKSVNSHIFWQVPESWVLILIDKIILDLMELFPSFLVFLFQKLAWKKFNHQIFSAFIIIFLVLSQLCAQMLLLHLYYLLLKLQCVLCQFLNFLHICLLLLQKLHAKLHLSHFYFLSPKTEMNQERAPCFSVKINFSSFLYYLNWLYCLYRKRVNSNQHLYKKLNPKINIVLTQQYPRFRP